MAMVYPDYDLWCRLSYANYVMDYKYFRQTGNDHWDSLYYALQSMRILRPSLYEEACR